MSYDIYARCKHCGQTAAYWSPTYNYSKMFKALGIYPHDFDGGPAVEYAVALQGALAKLKSDFDAYEALGADNGWGTAQQLLDCLPEVIAQFERARECEMAS